MATLVTHYTRKLQFPSWVPYGTIPSWQEQAENTRATRDKLERHVGHDVKKVIFSVAHGASVPEFAHEDEREWLNSLSREARLLRWVACSDFLELHKQFLHGGRQQTIVG